MNPVEMYYSVLLTKTEIETNTAKQIQGKAKEIQTSVTGWPFDF
jgi:hypothetical protein